MKRCLRNLMVRALVLISATSLFTCLYAVQDNRKNIPASSLSATKRIRRLAGRSFALLTIPNATQSQLNRATSYWMIRRGNS
jgi:hypothetical protein